MVHFNARIIGTLAISVAAVQGAPVVKRIAQVITDSTAKWEQACVTTSFFFQWTGLGLTDLFRSQLAVLNNAIPFLSQLSVLFSQRQALVLNKTRLTR